MELFGDVDSDTDHRYIESTFEKDTAARTDDALLELYREDAVSFEQVAPLGELYVTWTGTGSINIGDTDSVSELTESDDDQ